jgi:CO/xanthine dehydrogenase FAD-binding subunit
LSLAFRPKRYLRPETEADLSRCLKECGERGRIIAGGTGLYEIAHRGLLSEIDALIDISRLNLEYAILQDSEISIGAATTMSGLANSNILSRKEMGALGDALKAIQPLQVKNVATIGGAICTALPFLDLPVALLAIGADCVVAPEGSRKPLADFIRGYFAVELSDSEFLKEIRLPLLLGDSEYSSAFQKFALTHDDWAMMNCAVSVSLKEKRIQKVRIFFGGGLADRPARAEKVESELLGAIAADESRFKEIFDSSLDQDIDPITDIRASREYRMRVAKVLGRRTLVQAIDRHSSNEAHPT